MTKKPGEETTAETKESMAAEQCGKTPAKASLQAEANEALATGISSSHDQPQAALVVEKPRAANPPQELPHPSTGNEGEIPAGPATGDAREQPDALPPKSLW